MRTRASMGKMVNMLTKREKNDSFLLIERISRGVNHPYTKEFIPTVVASNHVVMENTKIRENEFKVAEYNKENVVVMRSDQNRVRTQSKIIFPEVFYEYFEVIELQPQKVG